MRRISLEISAAANADVPILIAGENGVGRRLIAHTIHDRSARYAGPLISIDCRSLPDSRLECDLFGREPASLADAGDVGGIRGRLEAAHGGTLILQDVDLLSLRLQGRLLRFMETRDVQRVGSVQLRASDVRVVGITQRRLIHAITNRAFREDLFYRMNVIHIEVPPLRERPEDVPALVRYFLCVHAARMGRSMIDLSSSAMACLLEYDWPGNVQELKMVIEHLAETHPSANAGVDALPREIVRRSWSPSGPWRSVVASAERALEARDGRTFRL
jgi:two-component system response regulator AtoC